jgi:hypothetical protein
LKPVLVVDARVSLAAPSNMTASKCALDRLGLLAFCAAASRR